MQKNINDKTKEKSVNQLIRESGLKATGGRAKILKVLSNAKKPLRVKDIYDRVGTGDDDDETNMVTIYRTIESFVKKGIVHRVDFGENAAYYELHDVKHNHNYITCTECRRHDLVDSGDSQEMDNEVKNHLPHYDSVIYHSVEYFGVCTACKEKIEDRMNKNKNKELA